MKKLISILLVLSLTFGCLILNAQAATHSGTCGNLNWKLESGTLTITGNGAVPSYTNVHGNYAPWHASSPNIKRVVMGEGVTSFYASAFWLCTEITSFSFPTTMTYIGMITSNLPKLKSITVASGNPTLYSDSQGIVYHTESKYVVAAPGALRGTVTVPEGIKGIESFVFSGCTGLETLKLPDSIEDIGTGAFEECSALKKVYYAGSAAKWKSIYIGGKNDYLKNAQIIYNNGNSNNLTNGWKQEGTKWAYYQDGQKLTNQWFKDGVWYFFGADGYMATDKWIQSDSKWCYVSSNGAKVTNAWKRIGGAWYYLDSDGYMATGWECVGGKWYYFNTSGVMQTGWQKIKGEWYYLNSEMMAGWQKIDGKWYYLNNNMQTGWLRRGNWYYLDSNGAMATGWECVGGKWYYFNTSGVMQIGWQYISGKWYYMNTSGVMQTGWLRQGNWYYLNSNGAMATGTHIIDGKTYTFNSSGVWIG